MMIDRALVTAADYHDAIVVGRRAKSAAALLALLMVLVQLGLFFTARYTNVLTGVRAADVKVEKPNEAAATEPVISSLPPAIADQRPADVMHYAVGLSTLVGFAGVVVLMLSLLLLILTLLVGRAVGVGPVTSAYVLTLILIVLMFPWQGFLGGSLTHRDFVVPGVLYTWQELTAPDTGAKFANDFSNAKMMSATCLHWARFVAFPLAAVVLLLLVQTRSNRGIRRALNGDTAVVPATLVTTGVRDA